MKVFRSNSNEIFSEVINASILKDSSLDDSFVCIILTLSNSSEKSFMPTVQINNDIRDFLCLSPTKGYIKNLSCSHQSIETSNGYYIKFNLKNISDDIKDELKKMWSQMKKEGTDLGKKEKSKIMEEEDVTSNS